VVLEADARVTVITQLRIDVPQPIVDLNHDAHCEVVLLGEGECCTALHLCAVEGVQLLCSL
jgi:hypothetical protein